MKLKRLKIEGLFDLFNYDIPLNNEEGLIILTGPNGYGKTKILNIVYHLFNSQFYFFQRLLFKKITFIFENEYIIELKKNKEKVNIYLLQFNNIITKFSYEEKLKNEEIKKLFAENGGSDLSWMENKSWIQGESDNPISFSEILEEREKVLLNTKADLKKEHFELSKILGSLPTYLIKEQRLISDSNETTIFNYAKRVKNLIKIFTEKYIKLSQELDSTFPTRLLNEKGRISEQEYKQRFNELSRKQEKLRYYGILDVTRENSGYAEENAKVLLVYLNDTAQKLDIYDQLLVKLDLFNNILNDAGLTHKSITISKEKGFSFYINKEELNLLELSSGEQHYIILFCELIFNTAEQTLILIDEPEISLHVAWQRNFLDNILKVNELQKINVVIATHSPSIINNYGYLAYDLYRSQQKAELVEL